MRKPPHILIVFLAAALVLSAAAIALSEFVRDILRSLGVY